MNKLGGHVRKTADKKFDSKHKLVFKKFFKNNKTPEIKFGINRIEGRIWMRGEKFEKMKNASIWNSLYIIRHVSKNKKIQRGVALNINVCMQINVERLILIIVVCFKFHLIFS